MVDRGPLDVQNRPVERSAGAPVTLERLRQLPKVDLHCHLDGSLRPETLLDLAREAGIRLPRTEVSELREYMRADNTADLGAYLDKFDITVSVLQTPEAIERVTYELVEDASQECIRYLEVRNAPRLNTHGGLSLDEVMDATMRGLERGTRDFGTIARFIVCSLRHWDPDVSMELANLAVRYKDRGVVAFDLAGGEAGHPAAEHADAFLYARSHDLNVTCHAGEGDGPESIRQAIHLCGAYRIGHGVRAREDHALVELLRNRQIPLELCPTSNVQTRAVASYEDHPLRQYYDQELQVTINTDNRLISGVTLSDEFLRVATHLNFSVNELARCILNACDAAFLPLDDRRKLRAMVLAELHTNGIDPA